MSSAVPSLTVPVKLMATALVMAGLAAAYWLQILAQVGHQCGCNVAALTVITGCLDVLCTLINHASLRTETKALSTPCVICCSFPYSSCETHGHSPCHGRPSSSILVAILAHVRHQEEHLRVALLLGVLCFCLDVPPAAVDPGALGSLCVFICIALDAN